MIYIPLDDFGKAINVGKNCLWGEWQSENAYIPRKQ